MADFSSLQQKVNALKAKVEQSSITPKYLGSILDDFITQMKSIDMTGMSDDVQTAVANATTALQKANQALTASQNATNTASSAAATAVAANSMASDALSKASSALSAASSAKNTVANLQNKIGASDGIAPLDGFGKIPVGYIPGSLDNVKDFYGFVEDISVAEISSSNFSTDDGCAVVYNSTTKRFVLRVATTSGSDDINYEYFGNWQGSYLYGDGDMYGRIPLGNKLYFNLRNNWAYHWDGSDLVVAGLGLGHSTTTAFPGVEGHALQTAYKNTYRDVEEIKKNILAHNTAIQENTADIQGHDEAIQKNAENINEVSSLVRKHYNETGIEQFGAIVPDDTTLTDYPGKVVYVESEKAFKYVPASESDSVTSVFMSKYNVLLPKRARQDKLFRLANELYRFDGENLVKLGGASVGNTYNLTAEVPTSDPERVFYHMSDVSDEYYAPSVVLAQKKAMLGLQITFAIAKGAWKTYQYIGADINADSVKEKDNWLDLAGMSAGKEPFINIDDLCGKPTASDYYSFESAIDALARLEESSGIVYRKAGMVITYRISESEMETLQLKRKVTDFGTRAAWGEFGGGGNKVVTKDDPAEGGKDAFSTGGAYNALPVDSEVKQEDGVVNIQILNAAGNAIMPPISFVAATGGGAASGTVISMKFKQSPLYGALGQNIVAHAAIRSITMAGNNEVDNAIARLDLYDRDTNLLLWSSNVNKASSTSMEDFSFEIDFSQYFNVAGKRNFTLIATDEGGNTGQKYITVTAEDLTVSVSTVQVLNVREDAMLLTTSGRTLIDMFMFENNQSDKGIEALVEIFRNNEWEQLQKITVTDTFTKAVTIDPSAMGLSHGAYPVRISGTSLNSGVKGNTVYTAIFVIDPEDDAPLAAIRYDDNTEGQVKLYESIGFDVAVYNPAAKQSMVNTNIGDTLISQMLCDNSHTYHVEKQIQTGTEGDVLKLYAQVMNSSAAEVSRSHEVPLTISGSVIDATLKEGALFCHDFATRSNTEADHSIADGGYTLTLEGANYTSNGFVDFMGRRCLRIAENVTASHNYLPFASSSLEQAGMAIQMCIATNNIKDRDAKLMECYDPDSGAGFYIKGNKVGIICKNGVKSVEERAFPCKQFVTVAIVVEPSNIYVERSGVKYSALRLYLNGELVGHIGYTPARGDLFNARNITMDGTYGDLYISYMMAYQTHYEWAQAWKNYLVKLSDTAAMIQEYNAENVLVSQTAEGTTAMRPSAAALWDRGMPYVVLVADDNAFTQFDNGTSTSDNFSMMVFYYDPNHPWRSFKAVNCRIRRQGTTSARRCKKNVRIYLSKASEITPLFPDYTDSDATLAYALFLQKKVRVGENTMPVDLITIKVDFSDAGGANDCGVCDMANATYRALGADYMTPAQRFFDGSWAAGDINLEDLEMNHSTANHPVAVFRSNSETLQNVWFEAKGNWKEDKGEQTALGFMNTPGYNSGCLNYQDESFVEYYGLKEESSIEQTQARFLADPTVDTTKIYLLSEYCGNRYRFMRYQEGEWKNTTGSMKQSGGKGTKSWIVSGDVLNPVDGYELLNYQGFCWWRGVDSLDEMMKTGTGFISSWVQKLIDKGKVTADVVPQWTYYFECMIDNDDLAIAYASGKKVPFELYRRLRFFDRCDNEKHPSTYANLWKQNLYKYVNVRSQMVYYGLTDYNSLYDQQAKNMQPMFFLEDGCRVENGVYCDALGNADTCDVESEPSKMLPIRMYFNKVYDADGANGKDNDGGCTGDPECDPGKPTNEATGYTNPYAGWNSVLWAVLRLVQEIIIDDAGTKTNLHTIIAAMRSVEANVDGSLMKPFSPEGATYFFLTKRLLRWPKLVSSYDGIRKYVQYTATADSIYFYALQGLGLTSLPDFIEKRWRIRDGYYQVASFYLNCFTFRIACAASAKINITAGATGYFGIGNDAPTAASEVVYLEAGQSHSFTNFSHETGAQINIFQPDRLSKLDLSEVSVSSNGGALSFSSMVLLDTLLLGSDTHREISSNYEALTQPTLGNLPFLETLDIRRTGITSLDASGCPRLAHLDARGSALTSFSVAETSPINDIAMTDSLTDIRLIGLPNLTYTGLDAASGLRIHSLEKVLTLRLEASPKLDARRMLIDILDGQESAKVLTAVRIKDMDLKGDASELHTLLDRNVAGLDSDGYRQAKPVVSTTYQLTTIRDQSDIDELEENIEGLTIFTALDAFIELIDKVNGEYYSGDPEVETVTLDSIASHLVYYNGETYDEYIARISEENRSIHSIITE